jgi:hypothetical protein
MTPKRIIIPSILAGAMLLTGLARADIIINISATQNGEQIGNESCTITCNGALIDPVQVTLGPGSYTISDAWSPTTGLEPGALYEAGNFEAGNPVAWGWHWKVLTDDGHDGATISPSNYASHLIADIDPTEAFSTESAGALFGYETPALHFTLSTKTTLDFVINDYYLPDNAGGVSLDLHGGPSPVPEASTWAMILLGFAGFGFVGRWTSRRAPAR